MAINPLVAFNYHLITTLKFDEEGFSIVKNDSILDGNSVCIFLCCRKENRFDIRYILPFPEEEEELLDAL